MESFEKAVEKRESIFHIDLDLQQNIKNKIYFKNLLKKIVESSNENLEKELEKFYHKDAELNAFYPINEIKGIGEIKNKLWQPLKNAFADLEIRNNIVIGGAYEDKIFVSYISHLTGTFINEWLGVPLSLIHI